MTSVGGLIPEVPLRLVRKTVAHFPLALRARPFEQLFAVIFFVVGHLFTHRRLRHT